MQVNSQQSPYGMGWSNDILSFDCQPTKYEFLSKEEICEYVAKVGHWCRLDLIIKFI
jgi:hypothetical protein